ncbi:TPA: hypothetical protein ACS7XC_003431 [Providencia alcalifaciens]
MTTITHSNHSPAQIKQHNVDFFSPSKTQFSANGTIRQDIQLQDISGGFSENTIEKPALPAPLAMMTGVQMETALAELNTTEKNELLDDLYGFIRITPERVQQAIDKVLVEEGNAINQVLGNNQKLDEADLK